MDRTHGAGCGTTTVIQTPNHENDDLGSRSRVALAWNFLGNGVRIAAQFVIGIVLARLLGPQPFGIVAVAWLVIGIANLVADMGFGSALVQRIDLHHSDIHFVFWAQVSVGVVLTLLGIGLAGPIAHFFGSPKSAGALQVMMSIFVFQAIGQSSSAVLRRDLNFKAVQTAGVASYLCGYLLIGIPLAIAGFSYWSLVGAQVLQSVLNSAILLILARFRLQKPTFNLGSRGIFSFGSKIIGANILSWLIGNLDSLVIGRFIGVTDLGLYNRVMALTSIPIVGVVNNVQTVLFAASARAQTDLARLKRAFLTSISGVGTLCIPVFMAMAAIPNTLILGIYGNKWLAAVPLTRPLALAMIAHCLLCLVGPSLEAVNKVSYEVRMQIITLLVMIPLLLLLTRYSTVAVAWGVCAVYGLRFVLLMGALMKLTGLSPMDVGERLAGPFLLGVIAVTGMLGSEAYIGGYPPLGQLGLDLAGACVPLLLMLPLLRMPVARRVVGRYLLVDLPLPRSMRRLLGHETYP